MTSEVKIPGTIGKADKRGGSRNHVKKARPAKVETSDPLPMNIVEEGKVVIKAQPDWAVFPGEWAEKAPEYAPKKPQPAKNIKKQKVRNLVGQPQQRGLSHGNQ